MEFEESLNQVAAKVLEPSSKTHKYNSSMKMLIRG